jgi:SAM-dependent methyltransferase
MPENVERFTGRVSEYLRYRERYDPEIVLPLLREWCDLIPQWTIADVGAGTGMLSDVFLSNGNRVVAIEPNAEMRTACRELHAGNPMLEVLDGTAEATGLSEASLDAVSAGRAFHWFNSESALREFRRVLKSGGWVILVAFGRAEDGREENQSFENLLRTFNPGKGGARERYAVYRRLEEFFAGGEFRQVEITGEMHMNWEELRGLTLSLSYAPLPDDPRFPDFEQSLREYFLRFENRGKVTISTRYWINAGRFAAV